MEQPNIFMSYLRVTQHMSQQFRSHFGRLDLTFPQALVLTVLGEDGPVPISALAALRAKAATDVSGYFSSLLSGMSQEDRAMIAAAFQKLDDALLQAGTEQSGP